MKFSEGVLKRRRKEQGDVERKNCVVDLTRIILYLFNIVRRRVLEVH